MNTIEHIDDFLLQDYVDGVLDPDHRDQISAHLEVCPTCRQEYQRLNGLVRDLSALPGELDPNRDLWPGIQSRLEVGRAATEHQPERRPDRAPTHAPRKNSKRQWIATAGIAATISILIWVFFSRADEDSSWAVVALQGTPQVDNHPLAGAGRLFRGDWLTTGDAARARLDVGAIGRVEVGPNSRIQLKNTDTTDHRLSLVQGSIYARISAPPRLFFVETPSALAVDLGCEYRLNVDSTGRGVLHVLSGFVGLTHKGRESIVPGGWMCITRPGLPPGTPFVEDATSRFKGALYRFDFEDGGADALQTVLDEARFLDMVTLWELVLRVPEDHRGRVYDRLVQLVDPPAGTTRDDVLRHDAATIEAWKKHLGIDAASWAKAGKKKK